MKRCDGTTRVNDDEWYTPRSTADKVAGWLIKHLPADTPILCPADILPDGTESQMPQALRAAGFSSVRVTRALPLDLLFADYNKGEVIVTNPPFSLLVPFRQWLKLTGARFCILARPASMRRCWTIPEMSHRFYCSEGRGVAAAWFQNIVDTSMEPPEGKEIGNCADCHRKGKCPQNSMTGGWESGRPRKLYGWGVAANHGLAGWFCHKYTNSDGKLAFCRFFKGAK